jgi:hypothetical protein
LADILNQELNALVVPPDEDEVQAGISRFDKFKQFNVIYSLADGDITKFDVIFNVSYSDAFITMYRKAEELRYSKKLQQVIKSK